MDMERPGAKYVVRMALRAAHKHGDVPHEDVNKVISTGKFWHLYIDIFYPNSLGIIREGFQMTNQWLSVKKVNQYCHGNDLTRASFPTFNR